MKTPEVQAANSVSLLTEANELRREIIEGLFACGGGHYGGALSVLDIILTLYRRVLRTAPDQPNHPSRDRFILSKGHSAIALYAVLRRLGFFNDSLMGYGRADSMLEGHPDMTVLPGVDFSTGSLGQGLSIGLGMAVALRSTDQNVWVVLGDGECQEGQVWETAMLAARYRIGNLHTIIDNNGFQEWGWGHNTGISQSPVEALDLKWKAFGWRVCEIDGHDFDALTAAFNASMMHKGGQPSLIIAKTIKGKGFPLIERDPIRFHCTAVTSNEQAMLMGVEQ